MFVEINGVRHPILSIYDGVSHDGSSPCKIIEMESTYAEVVNLFTNGVKWNFVESFEMEVEDENGPRIEKEEYVSDCSLYSISGTITDYRNGRISIEMIQASMAEILKLFEGVL
jgi:hypothetical protein